MFYFGIEHEVAFLNQEGKLADFSCTKFADFNQVIERLPIYHQDYPRLRIGGGGIRKKRWYIEGFERLDDSGEVSEYIPKGIEIRTTIQSDIHSTITELSESFRLLRNVAVQFGFVPVLVTFNPYYDTYEPDRPLTDYEIKWRQASPERQTEDIAMLTYGPDLNISVAGLPPERVIEIGRKLTYYSPYIIPFSYSSPFYRGNLWEGLSVRTFIRTGRRPAVMVYVEKPEQLISSVPSLTKIARSPAEIGRIEFKAFDTCDDFSIYAGLLALLKGLVLDQSLLGRATVPDPALHQLSAQQGFSNEDIFENATKVIQAAEVALISDPDVHLLKPLKVLLRERKTKAHDLIEIYKKVGSINEVLKQTYK
ncbi:glutamate--cysteine ligase [Aetokthonos hydrillicola Thurmond2011]|uniref:Glutamate--cysteine ligase n=1 Tax=Aetokthonos hydrillicola Thurmond2011 TaxID=2712845 RepID=A0AAP5M8V2_9CYAN|nr:glutamate--cysteine ligase [Aetokthonos hydrillicola]MBW4586670.1 glutamate--cysteine ligase [Aetokthonos hydrillicola CCALA 1050]MDR9894003.1 glutamate--cysteine ligase [Aetokthonos hydrillicola Thurmond2011]